MRIYLWLALMIAAELPLEAWGSDALTFGCANSYFYRPGGQARDIRLDGTYSHIKPDFPVSEIDPDSELHRELRVAWKRDLPGLKAKFEKSKNFKHESDYGLALAHAGRAAEALAIFERLAKEHPDEYAIASNLGTAYELIGDNQAALRWITEAFELHPESHEGTEWLHIRILEAKIAADSDPGWLNDNTVLGVNFGSKQIPEWPDSIRDSPFEQKRLQTALRYQLKERVQFVKPKDPVVAQLLLDLSSVVGLRYSAMNAQKVLKVAEEYANGDLSKRIAKQYRNYSLFLDRGPFGPFRRHPVLSGLMLLALCVSVALLLKNRRDENRDLELAREKAGLGPPAIE